MANEYFATSPLKQTSASRTDAVKYTYDAQERMTTMKTWQNFTADTGTAATTWQYVTSLGTANSNATVTLWSDTGLFAPPLRKGEYFRGELPVNNSTGAVWLTLTNVAVLNDGSNPDIVTNATGNVLLSRTPQSYTYDFDGNLTSDGLWTNLWNGENRRTVIESRSDAPTPSKRKVQWTHLPDGRWIERVVSTNNGTSYFPAFTNRYVWDNQVLLAVLNHTNGLELSFLRGLDLSGTMQGAGGVGGLLLGTRHASPVTRHFVANDGNGNVTALINATDGSESARYEYGPFAEPIRMNGPMAKLNPIRLSTQYADDVAGDLKYLFRDYDADEGRSPSRDPIGEWGGVNLYGFVANNPISHYDQLGLFLTGCSRSPCADPCGDLKKRGEDYGHAAGVACCGGKKYVCVWIPGGGTATGKKGTKIIKKCLEAHERDHFDDITCPPTGGPSREGWSPGKDPRTEECSAYKKERDCLRASASDCDGDPQCLNEVFARMRFVRNYMQNTLRCP